MANPFGGSDPPAALFHDSRDRGGTHPRGHPAGWSGILQADAYAGFNGLYAKGRAPAPLTEASCWAHGGARFFELADLAKAMRAPMAIEAVRRIDGNRRRPWSSPDAYEATDMCTRPGPPGYWVRHVGRVIRVIWGGPEGTRVAPSTSPWVRVPLGVGQGHMSYEAG